MSSPPKKPSSASATPARVRPKLTPARQVRCSSEGKPTELPEQAEAPQKSESRDPFANLEASTDAQQANESMPIPATPKGKATSKDKTKRFGHGKTARPRVAGSTRLTTAEILEQGTSRHCKPAQLARFNDALDTILDIVGEVRAELKIPPEIHNGSARLLRDNKKQPHKGQFFTAAGKGAPAFNIFARALAARLGFGRAGVKEGRRHAANENEAQAESDGSVEESSEQSSSNEGSEAGTEQEPMSEQEAEPVSE